MLLGMMSSEIELNSVQDDPAVKAATERVLAALQSRTECEAEEKKWIRMVGGKDDEATDDQIEEARRLLDVEKGTQNKWFSQAAQAARGELKLAEAAHHAARTAAQERLRQAGEAKLITLVKALDAALGPARELAQEIESLRHELNEGGIKTFEHPARVLLTGDLLDFQMRNCRTNGWI